MRARGGYGVSLGWKTGKLTNAIIRALTGGTFQVRSTVPLKIKGATKAVQKAGYYHYLIHSKKNEMILVQPADS